MMGYEHTFEDDPHDPSNFIGSAFLAYGTEDGLNLKSFGAQKSPSGL